MAAANEPTSASRGRKTITRTAEIIMKKTKPNPRATCAPEY